MPFLIIFSLALIIANIFFFKKKRYLELFIPCMLFLPEFYGIDFSASLPLLTFTRIMYIVFYIYTIFNRKRNINLKNLNIRSISKEYWLLFGYFFFRIISNLYYVTTYRWSVTAIFAILFEQLLLLIAIYVLEPSHDDFIAIVKAIVFAATILFAVGIFESFTSIRPFKYLYTVARTIHFDHYVRLGLLRSTATFAMPNFFGNMCLWVTPLIFYLHKLTGQKRYLFVFFLDLLAVIHSGCRSDMLFILFVSAVYILFSIKDKDQFVSNIKNAAFIILALAAWMILLSVFDDHYRYFYTGTIKSLLNVVGFNFDLNANAPSGVDGYGTNELGVESRTFQFSGIKYALSVSPLFGLGTGCQVRGDIIYYYLGQWRSIRSIDMGIVEIICSEGLIGLIGYVLLFAFIGFILFQLFIKKAVAREELVMATLMVLAYLLSTLSTTNIVPYLMLICAYFINKKEALKI